MTGKKGGMVDGEQYGPGAMMGTGAHKQSPHQKRCDALLSQFGQDEHRTHDKSLVEAFAKCPRDDFPLQAADMVEPCFIRRVCLRLDLPSGAEFRHCIHIRSVGGSKSDFSQHLDFANEALPAGKLKPRENQALFGSICAFDVALLM